MQIELNKIGSGYQPVKTDLGYDVFSSEDIIIKPGRIKTIKLGFSILSKNIEKGHYFALYIRESLGRKGLILVNGVGILSLDRPEREVTISVFNPLEDPCSYENRIVTIKKGDNIAQIILQKSLLF